MRRLTLISLVAVGAVLLFIPLAVIPARTQSATLLVPAGTTERTSFHFAGPSVVNVHFGVSASNVADVRYWMTGPSGMVFNESWGEGLVGGRHTYSFWTWGGDYVCGVTLLTPGSALVRVNVTSGLLGW